MRKQMRWLAVCSAPVDLSDSMTCSAQQHSWASLSVLSIDWPIQPCSLTATSWAWEGNPSSRSSPLNTPPTLEAIRLIHHMGIFTKIQVIRNVTEGSFSSGLCQSKVTWVLGIVLRKHFKTSELSENVKLIKKKKREKKSRLIGTRSIKCHCKTWSKTHTVQEVNVNVKVIVKLKISMWNEESVVKVTVIKPQFSAK